MTTSPIARGSATLLTLVALAGTASAVFVPKTSCPPGSAACALAPTASSPLRKTQPSAGTVNHGLMFSQGSDTVAATPHTITTFGHRLEESDDSITVFGQPLETGNGQVFVFRQNNNGDECEVCVEGDQVRVIRNGQPVDGRLIERQGQQIRVLNHDGQQHMLVEVPIAPQAGGYRLVERAAEGQPRRARVVEVRPLEERVVEGQPLRERVIERVIEVRPGQDGAQRRVIRLNSGDAQAPAAPQARIVRRAQGGAESEHTVTLEAVPGQPGQWRAHAAPGQAGQWSFQVAPDAAPARRAVRVQRHDAPTPPAAPNAPQVRVLRGGQGAGGHTIHVAPLQGGMGHAPQAGQMRLHSSMIPQPPVPPAPGAHAGHQIHGQVIIVGPDGQSRTINLGGQNDNFTPQVFEVPGGQVRVQTAPGGHQPNIIRRRTAAPAIPAAPAAPNTCDGSCCDNCCNGQTGAHSMILELGDLSDLAGQHFHGHLAQIQGLENLPQIIEGLNLGDLDIDLSDLQELNLDDLNLSDLGADIQVQVESALADAMSDIDHENLTLEIHAELQDAMQDVHEALAEIDLDNLPEGIRLEVEAQIQDAMRQVHEQLGSELHHHLERGAQWHVSPDMSDAQVELQVEVDDDQPADTQPAQRVRVAPRVQVQSDEAQPARARTGQVRTVEQVAPIMAVTPQPRVMLGITMELAPDDVLEGVGIESGTAIRVERVIEGLPAADAGLKEGSLIVGIEDQGYATPDLLREILGDKQPGDILTLELLVRGQRKTVEVTLAAFDPEALNIEAIASVEGLPSNVTSFGWQADQDAMTARIRDAIRGMTADAGADIDQEALRQRIDQIVREHFAQMGQGQTFTYSLPRGSVMAPAAPDQHGGMVFVQPTPPGTPPAPGQWRQPGPDVDARLNELSSRLDRLEQKLERLTALLEQRGQRD